MKRGVRMCMGQEVVCSECGIIAENRPDQRMLEAEESCGARSNHEWSGPDPLSRALARVEASTFEVELVDSETNNSWQWFEVHLADHDEVGASEVVADCAQAEGFKFVGVGESAAGATIRFNRKRGGD